MAENNDGNTETLDAAFTALRSEDVLTQNKGVEAAIQMGAPAVAGLLAMLEEPGIDRAQAAQVMYALAQIGDSRAAGAFTTGLRDRDERVRAYAAQGLARIGDPGAMAASLATLNDAADEMHLDITPSVRTLGGMGLKAVPSLLDLLTHDDKATDRMTRLHAQRALESILYQRHAWVAGKSIPASEASETMRAEWRANGDYDYSADAEARAASVAKWRLWLAALSETKKA